MAMICNYCGYFQETDEDEFCECGGTYIKEYSDHYEDLYSWKVDEAMANCEKDFYYKSYNNIGNILECKRTRLKLGYE